MFTFPGHYSIGLIFSWLTGLDPLLMIIGSMIPDLDVIPHLFGVKYRKTHRTITHSIFMPLIAVFFSLPLAVGIFLHIVVDWFTYPGIKLIYPFSQKEFYLIRGKFKKYHDPKKFLNDFSKRKKHIALELSLFLITLLIPY